MTRLANRLFQLALVASAAAAFTAATGAASDRSYRPNPADERTAAELSLQLRDLPSGWKAQSSRSQNKTCQKPFATPGIVITGRSSSGFIEQTGYAIAFSATGVFQARSGAKVMFSQIAALLPGCLLAVAKSVKGARWSYVTSVPGKRST